MARCRHMHGFLYFIRCKRDSKSCSTDQDSLLHFSCYNCTGYFLSIYRIITAFGCICSIVYNLMTFLFQKLYNFCFQLQCGVIVTNTNFHFNVPSFLNFKYQECLSILAARCASCECRTYFSCAPLQSCQRLCQMGVYLTSDIPFLSYQTCTVL